MSHSVERLLSTGRVLFGLGLLGFGIQNFIYADFVAGRAPAWPEPLPGRLVWAFSSGAVLAVSGAAIVSGRWARKGAVTAGTMILCWGFSAFLFLSGTQHFLYARFVAKLVPAWIPEPMFWAYAAGAALLAGGMGLLRPFTRVLRPSCPV